MTELIINKDLNKIRNGLIRSILIAAVLIVIAGLLRTDTFFHTFWYNFIINFILVLGIFNLIIGGLNFSKLNKLKNSNLPLAIIGPNSMKFVYTVNTSAITNKELNAEIFWKDIADVGIFKYGINSYITFSLKDSKKFNILLSKQDSATAKYYVRMCGTPAAFLVSYAEKTPESIKSEINYYITSIQHNIDQQ